MSLNYSNSPRLSQHTSLIVYACQENENNQENLDLTHFNNTLGNVTTIIIIIIGKIFLFIVVPYVFDALINFSRLVYDSRNIWYVD